MSWKITVGLYFVLWWIVIFAMLPIGVKSQHEEGIVIPGSDPGAPSKPMMLQKALWTTIATAIIVGAIHFAFAYNLISVD